MGAVDFGAKLLRLYAGADYGQLGLRESDHNAMYAGKRLPLAVTISATHRCNLVCSHCQSENSDTKEDISTERFLKLIEEIAEAGATRVGFTGGEPLMRKDMGRILERCRQRGLIVSVVSNGWLVKRNIDWLRGINLLFLSLDGGREVHDKIRGPGNFEKFVEAVSAAQGAGIPVAALSTLSSMNAACVPEMADIIVKHKLHWMVGMIQSGFTKRSDQDASKRQMEEMVRTVAASPNLRTSKRYLDFVLGEGEMKRCFAGIGYCIIAPNGNMYPCFPAEFDHAGYAGVAMLDGADKQAADGYRGISILEKPFQQAFDELPLYRRTCSTCALACHVEANYLYEFTPDNIRQSLKLMRPAA
ncbi:MAG: radical SAM protein [Elusimicrobia bacterium]|nr:radical SAM protein [Elusimicrobiota bacterium]